MLQSSPILFVPKNIEFSLRNISYIRDFFEDNQGKALEDAIKCWKYKKSQQGHNRYEREDLIALEEKS